MIRHIYLGRSSRGLVKIGITSNVPRRWNEIDRSTPGSRERPTFHLPVIGARALEKTLHALFYPLRHRHRAVEKRNGSAFRSPWTGSPSRWRSSSSYWRICLPGCSGWWPWLPGGVDAGTNFFLMPIDYKKYHPRWKKISLFIRRYRARNRCEWCGVENYQPHPITGSRVILTVAHIDHDRNNNSFFNLAALCQRCHLRHDAKQHARTRREKRNQWQTRLFE